MDHGLTGSYCWPDVRLWEVIHELGIESILDGLRAIRKKSTWLKNALFTPVQTQNRDERSGIIGSLLSCGFSLFLSALPSSCRQRRLCSTRLSDTLCGGNSAGSSFPVSTDVRRRRKRRRAFSSSPLSYYTAFCP